MRPTLKITFSIRSLLGLTLVIAACLWLLWVQPWQEARFRPHARRMMATTYEAIRQQWSAESRDTGLGTYIKCIGAMYHGLSIGSHNFHYDAGPEDYTLTFGTCVREASHFSLAGEFECAQLPKQYDLITWGQRYYLLSPDEIDDFKAAVADGSEPRSVKQGAFFLRDGDEAKPATGSPAYP